MAQLIDFASYYADARDAEAILYTLRSRRSYCIPAPKEEWLF